MSKQNNPLTNPAYIVAAKRTPISSFLGKLSKHSATDLGSIAMPWSLLTLIQGKLMS